MAITILQCAFAAGELKFCGHSSKFAFKLDYLEAFAWQQVMRGVGSEEAVGAGCRCQSREVDEASTPRSPKAVGGEQTGVEAGRG